jgi:uncharacterized protein
MTDEMLVITQTVEYVKDELEGDSSGHDWWHVFRVWKTAARIAEIEHADMFTVQLAALLHDIGDYKFNDGNERLGSQMSRHWLEKLQVNESVICHVCEIVSEVSFRGVGASSGKRTLESMIVQDADRLDAIGAIGVARAFAYGGWKGHKIFEPEIEPVLYASFEEYKGRSSSSINHFAEKLLLLKELMNTETARRVAEGRHKFMLAFLEEFFREWECRDMT